MSIRISASALVLTVGSAVALAQQPAPMAGAGGMVITTALRNESQQYAGWLMTAFDSIPASKYGFRPTPPQMTVGTVATHLEYANYLLCSYMGGMPHAMAAKDSLPDSVRAAWPKDTLVARLKASFAFCKAAFDKVTDANLADSVATGPPFRKNRNARARLVILFTTDLVDHYSQMANYMRMMGMIPPSSYPPPKS
jgi:DinB superfamily